MKIGKFIAFQLCRSPPTKMIDNISNPVQASMRSWSTSPVQILGRDDKCTIRGSDSSRRLITFPLMAPAKWR